VKVIDFGAAHSAIKEAQTAPRVVIGNLAYMSPEQARKRPVDGRADVFSAAVVLWELIAWQSLPAGGDAIDRWRRAARPRFEAPSSFRAEVPPEVDRALLAALSTDPRDRPPNAGAFRDELQRLLVALSPETEASQLGALMQRLFTAEASGEQALLLASLAPDDSEALTDPECVVPLEPGRGSAMATSSSGNAPTVPETPSVPPPPGTDELSGKLTAPYTRTGLRRLWPWLAAGVSLLAACLAALATCAACPD